MDQSKVWLRNEYGPDNGDISEAKRSSRLGGSMILRL